jgi:hypothetical protein
MCLLDGAGRRPPRMGRSMRRGGGIDPQAPSRPDCGIDQPLAGRYEDDARSLCRGNPRACSCRRPQARPPVDCHVARCGDRAATWNAYSGRLSAKSAIDSRSGSRGCSRQRSGLPPFPATTAAAYRCRVKPWRPDLVRRGVDAPKPTTPSKRLRPSTVRRSRDPQGVDRSGAPVI